MSDYPTDLKYTKDHEWARQEGADLRMGITAHAVEQLGDITLVDLPAIGTQVVANERCGDIESVKTVSELFAPVSGEVVAVNDDLADKPEAVNDAPYDSGWMVLIRPSNPEQLDSLLDRETYVSLLATEEG